MSPKLLEAGDLFESGAQLVTSAPSNADSALVLGRQRLEAGRVRFEFGRIVFFEIGLLASAYVIGVVGLLPVTAWTAAALGRAGAPRIVSFFAILALLMGVRAGRRGAFLPIDRPALVHVLSAPVSWPALLRPLLVPSIFLRISAGLLLGVCLGAGVGFHLTGASWLYAGQGGALTAGFIAVYIGSGLLEYSQRVVVTVFHVLIVVTVVATVVDIAVGTSISWATAMGSFVDASPHPVSMAWGLVPPLMLAVVGVLVMWEIPADVVLDRSELLWSFGFGLADESPRSLWLSYRRMSGESPRQKAWLRTPRSLAESAPVADRDLRGLLRTPAIAVARLGGLIALGCYAMVQLDRALPVFALVAGLTAYLIALEVLEGLAQEGDSPELVEVLPLSRPRLITDHLLAPGAILAILWAAAGAAAAVASGRLWLLPMASVVGVLGGIGATLAAAYSMTRRPERVIQNQLASGASDATFGTGAAVLAALLGRYGGPVLIASVAYLPIIAAVGGTGAYRLLLSATIVLAVYVVLAVRVVVWGRTAGVLATISRIVRRVIPWWM